MKETKATHLNLSKELHKQLKLYCVENDIKLNNFVCQLIKEFFEKKANK